MAKRKIFHVKIKNIHDIHKCNYMKFYDTIAHIIGPEYELYMTNAEINLVGERAGHAVIKTVESDSDLDMSKFVLSLKPRPTIKIVEEGSDING